MVNTISDMTSAQVKEPSYQYFLMTLMEHEIKKREEKQLGRLYTVVILPNYCVSDKSGISQGLFKLDFVHELFPCRVTIDLLHNLFDSFVYRVRRSIY